MGRVAGSYGVRGWVKVVPQKGVAEALVAADLSGMRCDGVRCAALTGTVGKHTACSIHPVRPDVCRTCMPGDVECLTARASFGL